MRATGAALVATGNIGCLTQLERHLADAAPPVLVQHTIELLDSAMRRSPLSFARPETPDVTPTAALEQQQ